MANDNWKTPPSVIDYVKRRWGEIDIDLCASRDNRVCELYYSEDDSFLDSNACDFGGDLTLWCNPPYSNPLPFVKHCADIASREVVVIMLLNLDTSTKWFSLINDKATGIYPIIGGRLAFHDEEGRPIKGNNKPQVLVKFGGFGSQRWESINIDELQQYKRTQTL